MLASLSLAACASAPKPPPSGRIQTTEQVNRSGFVGAASAPARDLNMLRTKIPPVLLEALDDPYKRPTPATCAEIIALVKPLNEALGGDIDDPGSPDDRPLIDKGRDAAEDTAYGFMAGAAQDLIPMRGWVRRLSGAEQHDRLVRAAIVAGGIRRGYLKGLGESRGCNPPATPSHVKSTLPKEPPRRGPRYPIK
ncbi:MAG: hypothetical protein KA105_00840 [Caulobacter sp.]|nr:hypothetical protein [Caulobacter sp.]